MSRSPLLRALQISAYAPPHLGGIEICAEELFNTLTDLGCELTWIASDVPQVGSQGGRIRVPACNQIEDWFGVPIPIPSLSAVKKIWRAVQDTELVHVHDVLYLNSILSVCFARLMGKPIIVTLHRWPLPYRNRWVTLVQDAAHHSLGRWCLRSAHAITCIHREVLRKVEGFTKVKCHLISNGIKRDFCVNNTEITPELQHSRRVHLKLPIDRRIAIFAGRFVENKGLHEIRAIAASLPDILFLMCGSGPLDPTDWCLSNVATLGTQSPTELRDLFLASDVLLLPSTEGGFPLVVPEAMACGLPCCILKETWLAWGEAAEYFVLLEHPDIIDQVVQYLASPFDFSLRRAVARYAKETWDWQRSSIDFLELYRRIGRGHASHQSGNPAEGN